MEDVIKSEYDIQKAVEMITALTRSLLSLPDDMEVGVHVLPQNHQYVASVEVAGFILRRTAQRMSIALEMLLSDLSERVYKRIAEVQAHS